MRSSLTYALAIVYAAISLLGHALHERAGCEHSRSHVHAAECEPSHMASSPHRHAEDQTGLNAAGEASADLHVAEGCLACQFLSQGQFHQPARLSGSTSAGAFGSIARRGLSVPKRKFALAIPRAPPAALLLAA